MTNLKTRRDNSFHDLFEEILSKSERLKMKLLLTSGGLTNPSISGALAKLVAIPNHQVHTAFIPTAANVEPGDKGWLVEEYQNLYRQGYGCLDVVDISALPRENWQPRLEAANILVLGGGNNFHLMYWLRKSGLDSLLPELIKTRVYVGISAGSMVTSKRLLLTADLPVIQDDPSEKPDDRAMGWIDFYIRPHFDSPFFPLSKAEYIQEAARTIHEPIYLIDDQTAIQVVDGKVEIISEGEYRVFNRK